MHAKHGASQQSLGPEVVNALELCCLGIAILKTWRMNVSWPTDQHALPCRPQAFLDEAEKHGKDIPTSFADAKQEARTVASEARMLKKMFLKIRD